jgi:NADH-quinone oxidoreductase subunit N
LLAAEGTRGNAEASIKYYLFGSISSALFAYGISIEYLCIGSIDFTFIQFGVVTGDFEFVTTLYSILTVCIISAYLYKLALFPFHFILPDVYQGVSWAVIGLLNLGVKLPIGLHFFYFWNVHFIHPLWVERTSLILLMSGLASVVIGCIGALTQGSLKRFMGYASINQMGFMIMGLGCTNYIGLQASLFYLIVYIWSLLTFSIILNRETANIVYLIDLVFGTDVHKSLLTLIIFSMGGVPPFIGFVSKYFIWLSLIEEITNCYVDCLTLYNLILILVVLITMVTSVISTFYYLRFIKIMWFTPTRRTLCTRDVRDLVYIHWPIVSFVLFSLLGWPLLVSRLAFFFNFWVETCYMFETRTNIVICTPGYS